MTPATVTGWRQAILVPTDAALLVVLAWWALVHAEVVDAVVALPLLGLILWLPGAGLLALLIGFRALLTPRLGLILHPGLFGMLTRAVVRHPAVGCVTVLCAALSGAGAYRHYTQAPYFPAGRAEDLAVIRAGHVRLYRHDPEFAAGLTRPDEARTLETYRYITVGTEPHTVRPRWKPDQNHLTILYAYLNWQAAIDPDDMLSLDRAAPASLLVEARAVESEPWRFVARAEIDPRHLWSSWFEPLPPGKRWLQWETLTIDATTAGGTDTELRFSADGPGARYVVVADTPATRASPERRTVSGPPRVILISLDTLAAGHVGHLGYPRDTTPNLDAFAERNVAFTRAFAPAPWTAPSHWSMMTGVTPSVHGKTMIRRPLPHPPESISTLAETLHELGYRTAAITGGYFVSSDWGFHRGFDVLHETWQTWVPEHDYRKDVELNSLYAIRWMDAHRDEPFFLLLHTYQPHEPLVRAHVFDDQAAGPVRDPATGRIRFPDAAERAELQYDSEILYTDRWLGTLLTWLDDEGLLADSLVIVTADHGDNFRVDSLDVVPEGIVLKVSHAHGFALYDDDVHVPLVVHFPESLGVTPQRVDAMVSLIDLAWTVRACVGARHPDTSGIPSLGRGLDLLPMLRGAASFDPDRAVVSEATLGRRRIALRSADHKLIRTQPSEHDADSQWTSELFDLTADPQELHDRRAELGAVAERFARQLDEYLAQVAGWSETSDLEGAGTLDEHTRRQLESIGYAQ